MKKPLFLLLVFLITFNHTYAAPVKIYLTGKITDRTTGMSLGGASIYFHEIHTGIIADSNGVFKSPGLLPGRYLIEITFMGYASDVENITITANTEKNFQLAQTAVEQNAVTVTGVSSATRARQTPQPVDIIKREDFQKITGTNAMDALAKAIPGVSGVGTGPAITKPFIRGLGYNRVLTINDGIRQEGQQWGDEHGIEIDDYSIQKIEVLKGPASLMYGSDALAGVINIISQVPVQEGTIKTELTSEYQTNSRLKGFYGNLAGNKHGFSWNAYASYKAAADYFNKYDGYVLNSKFKNTNLGAMAGYAGAWGFTRVSISNFDQKPGIVEGDRNASGHFIKPLPNGEEAAATPADFRTVTPLIPFQHIRHYKMAVDNSFKMGNTRLDATVGYQHNQRQEFGNPDDMDTPDAWFSLKTITGSLRFHLPYHKNFKTTIGINLMNQDNKNLADEVIIPDYSFFDAGAFIYSQYSKDKLTISGGLRIDNRHIKAASMVVDGEPKFTAFEKNFSNVSGSIGLSYEANKTLALKANVAKGFRAPNMAELGSNGAHEGTSRFEIGDKDLKSETSVQADAGLEINTEHISFEATVFYNHISHFIFYSKLLNVLGEDSLITDNETGESLNVFKFTQQSANLYGAEMSMDIHPHPLDWLHFKNVFSFTRGIFLKEVDDTKNLPLMPAAKLFSEISINLLPKGSTLRNLYFTLESDYNFKQSQAFTGYGTETPTGAYWLLNSSIGTDIFSRQKHICTVIFSGVNLTDVAYQSHLNRLKYTAINEATGRQGVFNMGRNFAMKINVPLSFKM